MSGDYSRYGFDPTKDFSAVMLEQGRPLTDRDWNDQAIGVSRRLQAGSFDVFGGAVVPSTTPNGFALTFDSSNALWKLQGDPDPDMVDLIARNDRPRPRRRSRSAGFHSPLRRAGSSRTRAGPDICRRPACRKPRHGPAGLGSCTERAQGLAADSLHADVVRARRALHAQSGAAAGLGPYGDRLSRRVGARGHAVRGFRASSNPRSASTRRRADRRPGR